MKKLIKHILQESSKLSNILGAFVIGGLLTYIAKNNSYFESED